MSDDPYKKDDGIALGAIKIAANLILFPVAWIYLKILDWRYLGQETLKSGEPDRVTQPARAKELRIEQDA